MINKNKYNNKNKSLISILKQYETITDDVILEISKNTHIPIKTIIDTLNRVSKIK